MVLLLSFGFSNITYLAINKVFMFLYPGTFAAGL